MSTMLIADNDCRSLQVMKEYFEAAGFEVDTAFNSTAVRMFLERKKFSVVILDVRLDNPDDEQDASGVLLAKTISPSPPIIIFAGAPSVESVRAALGANLYGSPAAADFIAKAEGLEVLLEAVRNILGSESLVTTVLPA